MSMYYLKKGHDFAKFLARLCRSHKDGEYMKMYQLSASYPFTFNDHLEKYFKIINNLVTICFTISNFVFSFIYQSLVFNRVCSFHFMIKMVE